MDVTYRSRWKRGSSAGALALAAVLAGQACGAADHGDASDSPLASQPGQASGGTTGQSSGAEPGQTRRKDIIQVRGTKGYLEMHEIRAGVAPHHRALNDCYLTRLAERRFLGGDLRLQILVEATGDVGSARIIESDLGDWTVERCALEVTRRMRFGQPKGSGRQAVFTVPLHLASDQPPAKLWPGERTAAVAGRHVAELDRCAGAGSAAAPGDVLVTLYVGERGSVLAVGFASSHPRPLHEPWADCAARTVAGWTFDDPKGMVVKAMFRYRPKRP